jgi:hypothetical protein
MLCIDSFLIEEKGGSYETPIEKIGRESRKPHEHVEASTGLEHEKDNRLLKEQSDHDDAPLDMRPVSRSRPETKLKHNKIKDGNCAISIFRTLVRPMPNRGSSLSFRKRNNG